MQYKIFKKSVGNRKGASLFATLQTNGKIIDTIFDKNNGIMVLIENNPSITLVNLEGNVTKNWIGNELKRRHQDGSKDVASFVSPCSICHNNTFAYVFEELGSVIRRLDLKEKYVETYSGEMYKKDFKNSINKKMKNNIIRSAISGTDIFITSSVSNKIHYINGGNLVNSIGDGKARFSISSDYMRSSFNRPSSICMLGDILYIADTNNHCIRKIDGDKVTVALGHPLKNILSLPSGLVIQKNTLFILDNNQIKVTTVGSKNVSMVYEGFNIDAIEVDKNKNIYIFEREDV